MLSAQPSYHLNNKDNAVEFVSNMLHNEANNYLNNISTLSHMSKMCSSLGAHWPNIAPQTSLNPASAAAALATGHNIETILGSYVQNKTESDKVCQQNQNSTFAPNKASNSFDNSYDG